MISERRHAILGLIIEHYLRTGEPIGSKALCQLLNIECHNKKRDGVFNAIRLS